MPRREDGEFRAELDSVRNELAEATALLERLRSRVVELERRSQRPDRAAEVESRSGQSVSRPRPERDTEREPRHAESATFGSLETASGGQTRESEWPRIDWERTLGMNWFAIVGALAVVLGIGFFLKLAFDNNWINDTGRVMLGVTMGLALLGGGEYAQRRVPRWAQPVTAGGAAIMYLSIYAAFGLYQLIRPDMAFGLLAVVVVVASLLAIRYESMVIGLLGVVGAFISPALLGPELSDLRLLGLYILLVDLGILGISTFRNWRWFTLVGWVGSYGLLIYGLLAYYPDFDSVLAHVVLTGVFLIFAAATPLFHILWKRMPDASDLSLMSLNATGYFGLTFLILWGGYSEWFGLIAFSLSAFYGLISLLALRRIGTSGRVTVFSLGIAVVFLTIAFPLQLDGYSVAILWSAQGAVFVWTGFYLGRWQTRMAGLTILALALAHLLLFDLDIDEFRAVVNWRFLTGAIVVATFYAAGWFYWRSRDVPGRLDMEKFALPVLLGFANLITLGLFSLEIIDYFYALEAERESDYFSATHLSLTAMWAVYGSAVASIGLITRQPMARWAGLGLLLVAALKLLGFDAFNVYLDPMTFIPILNIRFITFALVLALMRGLAFWFGRERDSLTDDESYVFQNLLIAANVVALWTLSQEVIHFFDSLAAKNEAVYFSAAHLSLTVLWAVYSMGVIGVGIAARSRWVRLGGIGLLTIPVAKLFAFDVFLLDMAYRVAAFLTLGVLLLSMGFVYQRYSSVVRGFILGRG